MKDTRAMSACDLIEALHRGAIEIETDGTPSQVGPSPGTLRAASVALATALNGLDRIGKGDWNKGAAERMAARDFAKRARAAALDAGK